MCVLAREKPKSLFAIGQPLKLSRCHNLDPSDVIPNITFRILGGWAAIGLNSRSGPNIIVIRTKYIFLFWGWIQKKQHIFHETPLVLLSIGGGVKILKWRWRNQIVYR